MCWNTTHYSSYVHTDKDFGAFTNFFPSYSSRSSLKILCRLLPNWAILTESWMLCYFKGEGVAGRDSGGEHCTLWAGRQQAPRDLPVTNEYCCTSHAAVACWARALHRRQVIITAQASISKSYWGWANKQNLETSVAAQGGTWPVGDRAREVYKHTPWGRRGRLALEATNVRTLELGDYLEEGN